MTVSRAKRKANNEWDKRNMVVLGCKIRKDKAEQFKTACAAADTTVNAVFNAAIDSFLAAVPQGCSGGAAGGGVTSPNSREEEKGD